MAGARTLPAPTRSNGVEPILLDTGDLHLSALLSRPETGAPRATVVALHGAGMNARYFDGQAHVDQSLFTLARQLGFAVVAVDRPGYGHSAPRIATGQSLREQSVAIRAALRDFKRRHEIGAGLFVLAHSFGGKVALNIAADGFDELLGLDISGCGYRFAENVRLLQDPSRQHTRNWGPLRLYPPHTFRTSEDAIANTPPRELVEVGRWPAMFASLAERITVPIRLTFAEYEAWWRHDPAALDELRSALTHAPRVQIDRQPEAGHNISLGSAARSYHLRALAFAEEVLARSETQSTLACSGA